MVSTSAGCAAAPERGAVGGVQARKPRRLPGRRSAPSPGADRDPRRQCGSRWRAASGGVRRSGSAWTACLCSKSAHSRQRGAPDRPGAPRSWRFRGPNRAHGAAPAQQRRSRHPRARHARGCGPRALLPPARPAMRRRRRQAGTHAAAGQGEQVRRARFGGTHRTDASPAAAAITSNSGSLARGGRAPQRAAGRSQHQQRNIDMAAMAGGGEREAECAERRRRRAPHRATTISAPAGLAEQQRDDDQRSARRRRHAARARNSTPSSAMPAPMPRT